MIKATFLNTTFSQLTQNKARTHIPSTFTRSKNREANTPNRSSSRPSTLKTLLSRHYTTINSITNPNHQFGLETPRYIREQFGIKGILPPAQISVDDQCDKFMKYLDSIPDDISKYVALRHLQEDNETVFYELLQKKTNELLPLIYTPTVGEACVKYSLLYQRPRGLFLPISERGNIKNLIDWSPYKNIKVVVITDGERILGLGDLGANGMGIPIGKLALYTVCAGIHPSHCLPITIDVGTNNTQNLEDPYYIGLKHQRVRGKEYDSFLDEVLDALNEKFNSPLIQFEDFGNINAFRILENYRNRFQCFNDDIQGTASVVLAGIYSATKVTGKPLTEQKFIFLGAGTAGTGIGHLIVMAMVNEGMSQEEAMKRCWFVDSTGLVVNSRKNLAPHKIPFAHDSEQCDTMLEAIKQIQPTGIIGVSGIANSFNEEILETMAEINERPIIFALSNPTSNSECTAEQAYKHTGGKAVFASGSPFPQYRYNGKLYSPFQGNNAYIFPGVGLGAICARAKFISEDLFFVAAKKLSTLVTKEELSNGSLYPNFSKIREVSLEIAEAVGNHVLDNDQSHGVDPTKDIKEIIKEYVYETSRGFSMKH